jgi:thioesterase domain-containing protein
MNAADLQGYVDTHIPIVKANRLTIVEASPKRVVVVARLADHVNHRDSAFGGSLSTALILAAWARVRLWTDEFDPSAVIVIAEQNVRFTLPVLEDFEARSRELSAEVLSRARGHLSRFGRARFRVDAEIVHRSDSTIRAEFGGEFVVVASGVASPPAPSSGEVVS